MTSLDTPIALRPDGGFLRDLIERAGDSFKRCYQCGTCSVVCPFSFAGTSLPRQEMVLAQWGLRDELLLRGFPVPGPQPPVPTELFLH